MGSALGPWRAATSGSEKRNVAPAPGREVAHSRPPWNSTMVLLIASPSPSPFDFVVKKGVKMRGSTSGANPAPVSLTRTSTPASPAPPAPRVLPGGGAAALAARALRRRGRLHAVEHQVQHHLLDLRPVALDGRQGRRALESDRDAVHAGLRLEQPHGLGGQRVHVH